MNYDEKRNSRPSAYYLISYYIGLSSYFRTLTYRCSERSDLVSSGAAHHRLNHAQACLWEILLLQSRVRTTRTSSRNDVLNKGKAGEACWRPLKLPTRAVHHRHPSVLAGESTQTYPGALSRSTAQPKNVEANVGAASRQRYAQLSGLIGQACKRARGSPRGTAWSNEKRRRLALIDPAANIGFSGVLSEPHRPRGHFGSAVLILLYFFRVRILESRH